jgi:hypothetical protein
MDGADAGAHSTNRGETLPDPFLEVNEHVINISNLISSLTHRHLLTMGTERASQLNRLQRIFRWVGVEARRQERLGGIALSLPISLG